MSVIWDMSRGYATDLPTGFPIRMQLSGLENKGLNDGHSGGYLGLACQPDFDGSGTGYEKKRRTRTARTRSASTPPGECVTRKLVCLNNGTRFRNEILLSVKKYRNQTPAFSLFHFHVAQDNPPFRTASVRIWDSCFPDCLCLNRSVIFNRSTFIVFKYLYISISYGGVAY